MHGSSSAAFEICPLQEAVLKKSDGGAPARGGPKQQNQDMDCEALMFGVIQI